jgi:hypothetical protein
MKSLLSLVIPVLVLLATVLVLYWDLSYERGGHEPTGDSYFAPYGSREQYIAHLLKTEKHSDPELWRRIEAVKRLEVWP